jgi:hypothetical protein
MSKLTGFYFAHKEFMLKGKKRSKNMRLPITEGCGQSGFKAGTGNKKT